MDQSASLRTKRFGVRVPMGVQTALWWNWQTRRPQNPVRNHVGSTPSRATIKGQINMITFSICLICILGALFAYARHREKILWNKGACFCGTGFWVSFDMDSQGGIGYKCSNPRCNQHIWISYHGVTK